MKLRELRELLTSLNKHGHKSITIGGDIFNMEFILGRLLAPFTVMESIKFDYTCRLGRAQSELTLRNDYTWVDFFIKFYYNKESTDEFDVYIKYEDQHHSDVLYKVARVLKNESKIYFLIDYDTYIDEILPF